MTKLITKEIKKRIIKRVADLKKSFSKNFAGIIWGSLFSFGLSLIIWGFAYFGYTDLGLPVRYDYEILNNVIKKELSDRYSYTVERLKFRDGVSESLLVIAKDRNWTSYTDRNIGSDIIFILDKTDRQYKISYKFQPKIFSEISGPLFARDVQREDIDSDGKDEVIVGWSYLGASFSPPYITVFKSDADKNVAVIPTPKIIHYKFRPDYPVAKMQNSYDKAQNFDVHEAHSFYTKRGELTALARNDDACNACGEEQIFELYTFHLESDNLKQQIGTKLQTIKTYDAVKSQLSKDGYEIPAF